MIRSTLFFSILLSTCAVADEAEKEVEPLVKQVRESLVTIRVMGRDGDELGLGTGFVIDTKGLIATNFHVIMEGRPFKVETASKKQLKVLSVHASDRTNDLALIKVDPQETELSAIELADSDGTLIEQGSSVLAFGNPHGLQMSVVRGIVSAIREIDDREMIQLAMPIEPGNSGGPMVDLDGRVHGIINMKSAVENNIGFAIPVERLRELMASPNPVLIDRWVRLGILDPARWTTLMGATWQQQAGVLTVRDQGDGFGGRALCLSTEPMPEKPFEVAVTVRLDDEAGAAGLAFHSDGKNKHYGFYPSNGNLRLTCFKGPSVFSWQVLAEVPSSSYVPGGWNQLKVRVEETGVKCYVNDSLVVESDDLQLTTGQIGLAKFRQTRAEFKRFRIGKEITSVSLSAAAKSWFDEIGETPDHIINASTEQIEALADSSEASLRELERRAFEMDKQAKQMRRLAGDVRMTPVLRQLRNLMDEQDDDDLIRGGLLIAAIDNTDIDIDAYLNRIDQMAADVRADLPEDADESTTLIQMDKYLFEENGFHGGRQEYYHPANSHLNRVIDDREGLPITMSILYMELGRRLGLNIEGVGLPGHFIVRHVLEDNTHQFVDVFERAQRLSDEDAAQIVAQYAGRAIQDDDLKPQEPLTILTRVLRNLMGSAARLKDVEAILRYTEALVAIAPDEPGYRMMRVSARHQTGRDHTAIEDLDWIIANQPDGYDLNEIRRMRDFLTK